MGVVFLGFHLLLAFDVLVAYQGNGLNKVHVTCDGKSAEISTQRYTGFSDFDITKFRDFVDLPIVSQLTCEDASVVFERRKDLLDRTASKVLCDGELLGDSSVEGLETVNCDGTVTVEVFRI